MESDDTELVKYNYNILTKYLHILGNDYYNNKSYNEAIFIYKELLDNIIDNNLISIIYSNICACYLQLYDYNNALIYGLQSIQYNKNNAITWGRIGWISKKFKKYEEAICAFKIANKLNPNNINYKNEITYFNLKKINNITFNDILNSSDIIINKLKTKILNNSLNFDNFMNDYEFVSIVDNIVNKI